MNLKLVPSDKKYAELFLSWRNHKSVLMHNPITHQSLDELKVRLRDESKDLKNLYEAEAFRWFGELDGDIVSTTSLKSINERMKTAEIGYGVAPEFQGRGIGKESVRLLINKVFHETNLRKIYALVHDENIASCRLIESLGFQKEGLLREHFLINGNPGNEVFYGLLRRDDKYPGCEK